MSQDWFIDELMSALPTLKRYAYRLDLANAEDLVHDTVVRALIHRDKFERGTNIVAWLSFIQRNLFLTAKRRQKWHGGSVDDMLESARPASPANQMVVIELDDTLKALQLITRDMREALLLVGAGASYEEAAEELCCSIGTVKSRVARGRDALREILA